MTLIYFIIVLGVTVLIHEFGHFIFAKKAGVYVYEFSIGMGPKLFNFKRKMMKLFILFVCFQSDDLSVWQGKIWKINKEKIVFQVIDNFVINHGLIVL